MPGPGYRNLSITADALDALNTLTVTVSAIVGHRVGQSDAIRIAERLVTNLDATDVARSRVRTAARDIEVPVR